MVSVPVQLEVDGGIAQTGQIILHYNEPAILKMSWDLFM